MWLVLCLVGAQCMWLVLRGMCFVDVAVAVWMELVRGWFSVDVAGAVWKMLCGCGWCSVDVDGAGAWLVLGHNDW
jgi:hypothetical protein